MYTAEKGLDKGGAVMSKTKYRFTYDEVRVIVLALVTQKKHIDGITNMAKVAIISENDIVDAPCDDIYNYNRSEMTYNKEQK